ncbi:MAG: hypothetical protein ACTHOF_04645 [Flavisolibacter sp.]|jgi:hypothetical protein
MESNSNLTPLQKKELDELHWRIQFQQKTIEQLKTNENIQQYFKQFNSNSVQQFIDSYSYQKARWHQQGEFYMQQKDNHDLKWIEAAWWHLEAIQQKKLFDIQCRWRAEEIQLPGIELCCDFGYWERNILNCPFVDPITKEEVQLYQDYLHEGDVELKEEVSFMFFFQHYESIKEGYESEGEEYFPAWYDFYNERKGTAYLMKLPDIRGEKEDFYIRLARSTQPGKSEAIAQVVQAFKQPPTHHVQDKEGKFFLTAHDDETLSAFVDAFEDKTTREYFKASKWFYNNSEEREEMIEAIDFFLLENEPVAIEANSDWKQAIREAVRRYTIQKISECLEEAFAQYNLNLSMNISFPERKESFPLSAKESVKADILLGRKLNGEPEDLNF